MKNRVSVDNSIYSKDNISAFLQETIYEELESQDGNADFELINKCLIVSRAIQGKASFETSQNVLTEIWSKIKSEKIDSEVLSLYNKQKKENIKHRGLNFKKLFLVAALVAALSALSAVIAGANGQYNSHDTHLFGEFMKIFIKKDHVINGNIEYFNLNTNESKNYSSVEDFSRNENIQGLCLPENLKIKNITSSESEGNKKIIFNPDDQNIYFSIDVNNQDKWGILEDLPAYTKTKTQKGVDVWLFKKETYSPGTGSTQVMFKINEWYYCISTSYPEKAIKLIDEFKEILP